MSSEARGCVLVLNRARLRGFASHELRNPSKIRLGNQNSRMSFQE
jgi:hypothetical protein